MNRKAFFRTFFHRELFSRKTYSLQVILSVAIGVGAVSGIQSYKTSLIDLIQKEAKNLMGSDLAFQTPEKIRPFQNELLDKTLAPKGERAEVVQFLSMLQNPSNEETALSLIRGMEPNFPFYGEIRTEPEGAYRDLDNSGILLEESLAKNLNLKLGDDLRLGDKIFAFRGVVKKEPGSLGGFVGMAPTSLVRRSSLVNSGLEERGSRIRYTVFAKLSPGIDPAKFKEMNFELFSKNDFTIFHNTESNSGSQQFITNTLDFLSLLGLASFFLGAIAIFISTRTRVGDSQKQLSILKCLGLGSKYAQILVLSETLILSLMGSVLGLFLGHWIQSSLPSLLVGVEADGISTGLTTVAYIEGIGLGLLVPILVSIHSLVKVGQVSPLNALKNPDSARSDDSVIGSEFGRFEYLLLTAVYILFLGVAYLDTGNLIKAIVLCSIFFILPLLVWLIYILVRLLLTFLSKGVEFPRVTTLVFRKFIRQYGLVSLSIIGLGSAIFVLLLSFILRESLLNLGGARQLTKRPNVFVLDIRNEQQSGLQEIMNKYDIQEYRLVPVIRGRLSKVNGETVDRTQVEKDSSKRDWRSSARTREYMLSYRNELYDTEKVTSGKFWNSDSKNEISVEKDFAGYLEADIGDELEFSIEGFPFAKAKGTITNLRTVSWSDMKPNFVVLFSGGDLEEIPGFYLSSFFLESSEDRFQLQKALVKKYPNITFIDTEKAVKSFEGIVNKVSSIINIMSFLLIFSSILLLVSVLYSSSKERLRELVFYRVVGARQKLVRSLILQEALFLAFFSFTSSLGLAILGDWVLNRFVLDLQSIYPWVEIGIVGISVTVGVVMAYYLTSRRLFQLPVKKLMKL
jgi:putative ABC transport system permease protein